MPLLFAHPLFARQNPLEEAKNTLSSWDNCMDKAYCNGRGHKRMDSNPAAPYPQPYGAPVQYSAPPPMNPYAQAHANAPPPPPAAPAFDPRPVNQQYRSNAMPTFAPAAQPERPAFATFDSTKAVVNEDSLPAMPTWKDGRDVRVEVEEQPAPQRQGDMELDRLDHNGSVTSGAMGGVAAAAVPSARRSPGPGRSPIRDNYGYPQNNSFVSDNNQGQYGQSYAQQDEYHQGPPAQNLSPVYGAGAGYAQQQHQPYGRRSPGQPQAYDSHDQLNQYNQPASYNPPAPYSNSHQDPYDQRDYYDEPDHGYQSPPPAANPHGYNASIAPSYHTYDQGPPPPQQQQPQLSQSPPPALMPGRPMQESSPVSAYPGQRSYTPVSGSVGQQQPYRAFTPGVEQQQQQQQQQYAGVSRKPVDGTYREI
ncbi:Sugar transporter, conserved site [Stemphylium lycopersici]|nr:Sugar transporter, conserved site [Stemphylium lycopersici]